MNPGHSAEYKQKTNVYRLFDSRGAIDTDQLACQIWPVFYRLRDPSRLPYEIWIESTSNDATVIGALSVKSNEVPAVCS